MVEYYTLLFIINVLLFGGFLMIEGYLPPFLNSITSKMKFVKSHVFHFFSGFLKVLGFFIIICLLVIIIINQYAIIGNAKKQTSYLIQKLNNIEDVSIEQFLSTLDQPINTFQRNALLSSDIKYGYEILSGGQLDFCDTFKDDNCISEFVYTFYSGRDETTGSKIMQNIIDKIMLSGSTKGDFYYLVNDLKSNDQYSSTDSESLFVDRIICNVVYTLGIPNECLIGIRGDYSDLTIYGDFTDFDSISEVINVDWRLRNKYMGIDDLSNNIFDNVFLPFMYY